MKRSILILLLLVSITSILVMGGNIKYGGVAVLGLSSGLSTLNYNPFSPARLFGVFLIYEPLLNVNVLTGEVKPWLAESYEWRNNYLELVFYLRKDVKWSDGVPFTAKDVEFTFKLLKEHSELSAGAILGVGLWSTGLKDVVAVDDYTVVFEFSKPSVPTFFYIVTTFIVPEHIWSKVDDPAKFTNPNPVGTGPFIFKNFDSANGVETFAKNPNYWQKGKPYIDGVKIRNFKSNEANIMAIIKGETDWSSTFIPDVNKVFISRNPKVNHAWVTQGAMVSFIPNVTKYPLNIAKFRLAIAMALDKEKIAKYGEYGYTPPAHPTGLRIPLLKKWFDKSLEPLLYSYNPEKAVELIESLGFERNAEGWFINPKTGEPLSFDLYVVSGWTDWVQSAQIIEDNLKKIGIKLNVKQVAYGQYASALYTGTFDFIFYGPAIGLNPYYEYRPVLYSKLTAPIGENAAGNFGRWIDPVTDAMFEIFERTTDEAVQKRAMSVIEKIMLTEVPVIPMFYTPVPELYTTRRFVGWPSEENPYNAGLCPWLPMTILTTFLNIHLK
ncbi:MAG TPA: ABC transporter substrate-binding protein [Deltaproteobacteria bacterium]|nr:ABC transporter substrate-binding protein [Deltaproteobacteria bacterium]